MKNNYLIVSILCVIFLISSSFIINENTLETENLNADFCSQVIKYSTDTLIGPGDEELLAFTEITINPVTNIITLESSPKDQETVSFNTQIENIECTFSEKLTSGKADYTGYILQKDGSKSPTELVLEARNGIVSLTSYDSEKKIALRTTFSKWEVIKNKD